MYLSVVENNLYHCKQEFMESEGIVLNDPQPMPVDPYSKNREIPEPSHITPSDFDPCHQFLTMDGKVK